MKKVPLAALFTFLALTANGQTFRLVNAASFSEGVDLAPGSIVSGFGTNLTNTTASATDASNLPLALGGVTLTVGGVASPLIYVSPTQVNALIDPSVAPGPTTAVLTSPTGTFTSHVEINIHSNPGLFAFSGTGTGDGAILNAVTFGAGAFSVTTKGKPTYLALFATGLDDPTPTVLIGGVPVPIQYSGKAPGFVGLQQINVQLPNSLAGAGRVEVAVESHGKMSNVVETVILPNAGQGAFASDKENQARSRELATMAYVPGTSLVLVTDENDDVVRVIDVSQMKVVQTIVLPDGAEPVALAVNSAGTLAVVAERHSGKVAIIDLTTDTVTGEVAVGTGPVSVAIAGTTALVVNQGSDSVSFVDTGSLQVVTTVPVGRGPRSVAVDDTGTRAYVTNEGDGTISVIDLTSNTVTDTITLDPNARPRTIRLLPTLGLAVVTEPSSGPNGKVLMVDLTAKTYVSIDVNPERSGGSSDVVVNGTTVYFANQTGGSVTVAPISIAGGDVTFTATSIKVGLGARALALDTKDNKLLVSNEASGTITVIDLNTNQIVGRIDAVRSQNEGPDDQTDDHSDRDHGKNTPTVTAISPASGAAGTSFTMTIDGTNLTDASDVIFLDPSMLPGNGNDNSGENGNGNSGDQSHGPFGSRDSGFTASNIQVNPDGTQLTVQIQIAAGDAAGTRVVRVLTPNGESTFTSSGANTFTITQ